MEIDLDAYSLIQLLREHGINSRARYENKTDIIIDNYLETMESGERETARLLAKLDDDGGISAVIESIDRELLRKQMQAILRELPFRVAQVLRLRYGFCGQALSLEEVGKKFGVSRERIRQVEKKALHRLRHPRFSRRVRDFL